MGCGASTKNTDKALSPRPKESESKPVLKKATMGRGENPMAPLTSPNYFLLPKKGAVEVLSIQYILKYSGQNKRLEVVHHHDESIISALSWTTESDEMGEYFDFQFLDKAERHLLTEETRKLNTFPYKWRTDKAGRFMGVLDFQELETNIFAQQGKEVENYNEEKRAVYMKGIETRVRNMWQLFVENWLEHTENGEVTRELVKAYMQDCIFMTRQKSEDPDKIKDFLFSKLSDPNQRKAIIGKSFLADVEDIYVEGESISDIAVMHIEKSQEQHNLSLVSNRNPLLSMSVDKKAIVLKIGPSKVFADVSLECKTNLFRWMDLPAMKDVEYQKEETTNFVEQCKGHEKRLIELLTLLKLPL